MKAISSLRAGLDAAASSPRRRTGTSGGCATCRMWTRCGSRISPRPPEACPPSPPPSTSSSSAPSRGGWRSPATWPGPTLVLGQHAAGGVVDAAAMRRGGVELVRRRGGGGAVYLGPGEQLWLDAWIPRDDPLWVADVSAAAEWVGAWWMAALAGDGGNTASRSTAGDRCPATRRPRLLRRPRPRRGVHGPARSWGSRSGGRGKGPCSPRAPTCAGIPRRCWRSSTSMWRPAAGLAARARSRSRSAWPTSNRRWATWARARGVLRLVPCFGCTAAGAAAVGRRPRCARLLLSSFSFLSPFLSPSRPGAASPGVSACRPPGGPVAGAGRRERAGGRAPAIGAEASAAKGVAVVLQVGRSGCGVEEKGVKWRGVV